jgi:hypothetical protein
VWAFIFMSMTSIKIVCEICRNFTSSHAVCFRWVLRN